MKDVTRKVTFVIASRLQAEMKFRDLSTVWKADRVMTDVASVPRGQPVKPIIPPMSFEVRLFWL